MRLTPAGLRLVDDAVVSHVETERELLDAALTAREQAQLAALLSRFPERSGDAAVDQ
uniref:Uncharacterized protein n=1 Tax=Janibacter limosus TaxID=53458 RepID=A0AC61U432_9MICO|nr:hypothetical protein [Janibacter limosus]